MYKRQIQFRQHAVPDAPWVSAIGGNFTSTAGARRGTGGFSINAADARDAGLLTPGLETLVVLDAIYNTDTTGGRPLTVGLNAKGVGDGGTGEVAYAYVGFPADGGSDAGFGEGALTFEMFLMPTQGPPITFGVHSAWLADGRGEGKAIVLAGPQQQLDAGDVECWDQNFSTTYLDQQWAGGIVAGDAGSCPPLSSLLP